MSEVDLNQPPADFMKQALNPQGEDPKGQPPVAKPGGDTPPAPPAKPEGGAPPAPTPPTPEKEKPELPKQPADPKGQPKTVEELSKDHAEATKKITELGEAKAQLFKTYLGLVEENPNLIKELHKQNPELAAQIAKEHWGYDSYDELMEASRIESIKEKDPEAARKEQEIFDIKRDNKILIAQSRTIAETAFYSAIGIMNNPFDPKYQQIQEALKKVSPQIIRENYAEALNIAKAIAFPGRTEKEIEEDKRKILLATSGAPESKAGTGNPANPPSSTPAQIGFAGMVGAKLS